MDKKFEFRAKVGEEKRAKWHSKKCGSFHAFIAPEIYTTEYSKWRVTSQLLDLNESWKFCICLRIVAQV